MKHQEKNKIYISFYIRDASTNSNPKRGVAYACISFKGKTRKFSLGLYCDDLKKDWVNGNFKGSKYRKEMSKIWEIEEEILSYDHTMFRNVDEVKDQYNGLDIQKYPMTVLQAFDFSMTKKKKIGYNTRRSYTTAVSMWERYLLEKKLSDFGILQSHPRALKTLDVDDFIDWCYEYTYRTLGRKLSYISIKDRLAVYSILFDYFGRKHKDVIPNIIHNPFKEARKEIVEDKGNKKKVGKKAIDWKWIEAIENHKYLDLHPARKRNGLKNTLHYERYRLVALMMAYSGLTFIDFGKPDILEISETIDGPALIGRRKKSKVEYTIPVTPQLRNIIDQLKGNMPWKPFIDDNYEFTDERLYNNSYLNFTRFLHVLSKELNFRDDEGIFRAYRFRHTFAMRMLNYYKAPLFAVAKMLGDDEKTVRKNYADYTVSTTLSAAFSAINSKQSEDTQLKKVIKISKVT